MIKVSADKAGDTLSELIALASESNEPILLRRRFANSIEHEGQPVTATIRYSELKRFQALEDARDSDPLGRALAEAENEESFTIEEAIEGYNQIHGTNFTVEKILNDPD